MSVSELVVGVDGFVGARLQQISGAKGTSRRRPDYHTWHYLDLLNLPDSLPNADVVYICAGVNGAKPCEGNPVAYRINVDATIKLTKRYLEQGSFVVWISTASMEWANSSYARQKERTEIALSALPRVGIVRAGRILNSNIDDLCQLMLDIGRNAKEGIFPWNQDENPYAR